MRSVLRSILAIIAGFVVASLIMMAVESFNGRVLFPELGRLAEGMTDREAIRSVMAAAPTGALLVVIGGWLIGSFVGGWASARIVKRSPVGHALALGGLLTLAGVANNLMLPPPLWFWIAGLAFLLPAAYAGARLEPGPQNAPK